jgi:AraC family transcriptional activator of pobA
VVTATQKVLESLAALLMPGLVGAIRAPRVLALPDTGALEALMPLFLAIERESRSHSEGQTAAGMALLTALLVQVARLAGPADSDPVGNTAGRRKQRQIQQFKALLDRDFRQHRPVQAYAGALGLTAGQLSRICREVLGMSALDVIHARLVHEAKRELVYTVGSIQQLAAELGFEDDAYFSRFFKRHTGLSPRAFRAQALAQLAHTNSP